MTDSSSASGHGTGSTSRAARTAGAVVAWVGYLVLHVVYRALWLPCDLIVFLVAYVMHARGASRARVLAVCTMLVAALDVAAGLFLWFIIDAIPRAFGHMFDSVLGPVG